MSRTSLQKVGDFGEKVASEFLMRNNYSICETNYFSFYGEIDIIAKDDTFITFIEVKTRASNDFSEPIEAVNREKRMKIIKTAMTYLSKNKIILQPRFDIIEILACKSDNNKVKVRHIKNAFSQEKLNEFF